MTSRAHGQRGVTLIELMVAMVLGLFITGAVLTVFLSNRQAFRQTENLSRLQENARIAFEFLSRDLREAGSVACGNNLPTVNVLTGASGIWWASWYDGMRGYEGNQALPAQAPAFTTDGGNRVPGSDAVIIWSGTLGTPINLVEHDPAAAEFVVSGTNHDLVSGDVAVVCDYQQAAVVQLSQASSAGSTLSFDSAVASTTPGNCRQTLGLSTAAPHDCSNTGSTYTFRPGGLVSRLEAYAWYLGENGRGGTSLYRTRIISAAGEGGPAIQTQSEEMVEDVTGLAIEYLVTGAGVAPTAYVDAAAITNWAQVGAIRVTARYATPERVGTDGNVIDREFPLVVTLRNRMP